MKKYRTVAVILLSVMLVSFIGYYAGHFLLKRSNNPENIRQPIIYKQLQTVIDGNRQVINILEVDLKLGGVEIKPVLSHDSVFGFEKMSAMVQRSKANAAVNAGFFHIYGNPSGMVIIDGRLITNSTGEYPVFTVRDKKAALAEIKTRLWVTRGDGKLYIDNINKTGNAGETILYTPVFGSGNRAKTDNITVTVTDNIIEKIGKYRGSTDIPRNGMLLTFFQPAGNMVSDPGFKKGDRLEFKYEPYMGGNAQAYECGCWIVKNGAVVAGDYDRWTGVLTNHDPRTAIGLKNENTVVLVTVDGRQPGHSTGFTGKELGDFLLGIGVKDAAMLDGGASTEMILNGEIVNRPSYKGQERMLGGTVIVKLKDAR